MMIPIDGYRGLYLRVNDRLRDELIRGKPITFAAQGPIKRNFYFHMKEDDIPGLHKVVFIGVVHEDGLLAVIVAEGDLIKIPQQVFKLEYVPLCEIDPVKIEKLYANPKKA